MGTVSSVLLRVLGGSGVVFRLGAPLLQLVDHAIEIRISGAKASGEPVAAALYDFLAIGQHVKLAGLSRCNHGVNAQPLFDHGRETRSLGFVALSCRAGTYLDLHSVLQVVSCRVFPDHCYTRVLAASPCSSISAILAIMAISSYPHPLPPGFHPISPKTPKDRQRVAIRLIADRCLLIAIFQISFPFTPWGTAKI
jgi:hypothetical protein